MERRMECGVMVDLETLQELHAFLGRQLEQLQELDQMQANDPDADQDS